MNNKIFILHFQPIELYPPIQNLIRVLEQQPIDYRIYIVTTKGHFTELNLFVSTKPTIKIIRLGKSGSSLSIMSRYLNYFKFYAGSLLYLIFNRPKKLFYYESLSSLTPYLYKRFINKRIPLYIHYHEYTSVAEYQNGMVLTKIFHRLEQYLYPQANWVSHTNRYRMQLFKNDIAPTIVINEKVLANYPPKNWNKIPDPKGDLPIKIVYAGSLSMDTMYTKQFAAWVEMQMGLVLWHIYAFNITSDAVNFFATLNSAHIVLKGGVNYDELPAILPQYHVGIILYKGHIANYIYNAPNKLFEYISCGLDVWYPHTMKGCFEYDTVNTNPVICRLDFNELKKYKLAELYNKTNTFHQFSFCAEEEYAEIITSLLGI